MKTPMQLGMDIHTVIQYAHQKQGNMQTMDSDKWYEENNVGLVALALVLQDYLGRVEPK